MTPRTPDPGPRTPVSRASVRAWLLARQPEPPATLAAKLADIVAAAPDSVFAADSMTSVMAALGMLALRARLGTPDSAMDLLAADAFVTYAFESASEEGTDVTGLASRILAAVHA